MKVLSIIIATYNAEKTLTRCLESIVSQKSDFVELLVIDGGSTDHTSEIEAHYQDSIDFLLSESDAGIYDAWNKGLGHVSGQWIMFLGADDTLLPGSLSAIHSYLNSEDITGVDLICAQAKLLDKKGVMLKMIGHPYNYNVFRHYMNVCHGATLHNRNLFDRYGLFNLQFKICGDYELLLRNQYHALFFETPLLGVQYGGRSCSCQAVREAFQIRRMHHSIPMILNILELIKGIVSVTLKKVVYK